ncbi:MAG: N-acetyltransferase family protein [Actinomycetes bacterium]
MVTTVPRIPSPRTASTPQWEIEPLPRGDAAAVVELFEAMSPASRWRRFLSPVPRLTERMLSYLSDVDGERHLAVAARAGGRCVGIARAIVVRDNPSVADLAVAVADAHHKQGLGRRLVERLAIEARALGIREFEATVHPENDAARALARTVGSTVSYDEGLLRVLWPLPGATPA